MKKYEWDEKALRMWTSEDAYFTTNSEGEGIFRVDQVKNSRSQIAGTCEFSIRGIKPASAKRKLRNFITE